MAQPGPTHPQDVQPGFSDERGFAERIRVLEPVVPLRRLGERSEFAGGGPIKVPAVNDYAADGRAVPADPLCSRVDDYVRAVLDRSDYVAALGSATGSLF